MNEKYLIFNYKKEGNKKIKHKGKVNGKKEKVEILYFKKDKLKKNKDKDKKVNKKIVKIEDKKMEIVGYAKLNTKKIPDDVFAYLNGVFDQSLYVTKKKHGIVRGYVKVSDNEVIGIYKYSFLFLIFCLLGVLLGLWLIALITILLITGKPINDLLPIDPGVIFDDMGGDAKKEVNQILSDDRGIDFPIYSLKEFVVNDSAPTIKLGNPESNIVMFQYIITDSSGDEIFKTNLINPGRAVAWNPKEYLDEGTYDLTLETKTYTSKNQTETNGFKTSLKLTIS